MISYHDLSVITQLLRDSQEANPGIVWHQRESGAYFADFGEGGSAVCVEIGNIPTRTGGRTFIKFSSPGLGEVHILEPIQSVFTLRKKYDTPEETELADTMNRLLAAASRQHTARARHDIDTAEERKQAIFRRLFGARTTTP